MARTLVDIAGVLGSTTWPRLATRPASSGEPRRPTSRASGSAGFLKRLRAAKLPLPVTNKPKGSYRVDCRWAEYRLTVELDSYRHHNSRRSWEKDRHREREARARGDDFRRYTWDDVFVHPRLMMRELTAYFGGKRPG